MVKGDLAAIGRWFAIIFIATVATLITTIVTIGMNRSTTDGFFLTVVIGVVAIVFVMALFRFVIWGEKYKSRTAI